MAYQPKSYRKFLAGSVSAALVASAIGPVAASADASFSDVTSATFGYEEITSLHADGVINGYPDGTYKPGVELSRGQAAKLFQRGLDLEVPADLDAFADVSATDVELAEAAAAVKAAGIFNGSNGEFGAADQLTREQMATVLVRAFDLEAQDDVEVTLTDLEQVDNSHRANVEILFQNGVTTGKENGTIFAPKEAVNRATFAVFLYRAMNLEATVDSVTVVDATTLDVVLSDGTEETVTLDTALEANVATEVTFEVDGVEYTETVTYVVTTPEVTGVSAINLVQTEVVFTTVVDADTAEDAANYTITLSDDSDVAVSDATLLADGKTVVLTHAKVAQQGKTTVDVEDVEDLDGNVIEDFTSETIEYLDMTIPEVLGAEVVGNDTIKVTFSEPMTTASLVKANFEVNDGDLFIDTVTPGNNNTEAYITLFSTLEEGEVTVKVKADVKDEAGFGVLPKTLTVDVVEDTDAPTVVGFKDATPTSVTLVFNEEIQILQNGVANFYHTNSNNQVDDAGAGVADYTLSDNNKELTLNFTTNELPEGTAYVYILEDAISDLWDNENTQIMVQVDVEVDETAPTVEDLTVNSETQIEIEFSEALDSSSAEDFDNYTLLDKDGEDVSDLIDDITYASEVVTIDFTENLSGDYSLVIQDVEDVNENKISTVTKSFNVDDLTAPVESEFSATIYNQSAADQMLRIDFGQEMATEGKYSVLDLEKYVVAGSVLADVDADITIDLVNGGKSVEITIPSFVDHATKNFDVADTDTLVIARVADKAGNYTNNLTNSVDIIDQGYVNIESVEATALNKVVVEFNDLLGNFDATDLVLTTDNSNAGAADTNKLTLSKRAISVNSDGNTVVTLTLAEADELDYIAQNGGAVYAYIVTDNSENQYGESVQQDDNMVVADKIKPTLYDDGTDNNGVDYLTDNHNDTFDIQFTENVTATSTALAGNDLVIKVGATTLLNGIDFQVSTIGGGSDTVTITLLGDYRGFDGELDVALASTVNYIKDVAGNKVTFDAVEFDVAMAPTVVTPLGTGTPVTLDSMGVATGTIEFSETLSAASKLAVEAALDTANATGTGSATYSWDGAELTITAVGGTVIFTGADVTEDISDGTQTTLTAVLVDAN